MKKIILLIALVSAFTSNARSLHPNTFIKSATLTSFTNIDQDSHLAKLNIIGGNVSINELKNEVALNLEYAPVCRPHLFCAAVLMNHKIELPIVSRYTDRCNNHVVIAKRDERPVDGVLSQLVIVDHSENRCPTFIALPATSISFETEFYSRINAEAVRTMSTFEAEKLERKAFPVF